LRKPVRGAASPLRKAQRAQKLRRGQKKSRIRVSEGDFSSHKGGPYRDAAACIHTKRPRFAAGSAPNAERGGKKKKKEGGTATETAKGGQSIQPLRSGALALAPERREVKDSTAWPGQAKRTLPSRKRGRQQKKRLRRLQRRLRVGRGKS